MSWWSLKVILLDTAQVSRAPGLAAPGAVPAPLVAVVAVEADQVVAPAVVAAALVVREALGGAGVAVSRLAGGQQQEDRRRHHGYRSVHLEAVEPEREKVREREVFYLTTHSTHFIYGYMFPFLQ